MKKIFSLGASEFEFSEQTLIDLLWKPIENGYSSGVEIHPMVHNQICSSFSVKFFRLRLKGYDRVWRGSTFLLVRIMSSLRLTKFQGRIFEGFRYVFHVWNGGL